ncbi:MAG TPA: Ig-like domain-containing protein [Solirubrobacter sp.]|nr:Ig-like domain-containing protein [Solirubrobacter sp.]
MRSTLETLGLPSVARAADVPADLSPYQSVWYVEAYAGLDSGERDRLVAFSRAGGNLYLTGERPCCETLNSGVQDVLRRTLKNTNVQVGGLGYPDGPFAFNASVTDYVQSYPNFLVEFVPDSPGGIDGIGGVDSSNVLARNDTVAVGAVWPEKDMVSGKGRTALLMDIDWLKDTARTPIVENLANFLSGGTLCSGDGANGISWVAGPRNCSAINTPVTVTWTASAAGAAPQLTAAASGVTSNCSSNSSGSQTTLTCRLTNANAAGGSVRVTASSPAGQTIRHYRVRPKNDPRNVPSGQALDSNWWDWPDADDDGLPDHWEQNGVWVKNTYLNLPARGADKNHKDLFLLYEFQSGHEQTDETLNRMIRMFADAPLRNPDDSTGVRLHIKRGASIPSSVVGDFELTEDALIRVGTYSGWLSSPEYGGGGVPPIYKWMLNFDSEDPTKRRKCDKTTRNDGCAGVKGLTGWTATGVSPTRAALSINLPTWDAIARESARAFVEAANAAHELGHQLGLRHHGSKAEPPGDKNYKSIMSYAYSHFGLPGSGFLPEHHIDYSRTNTVNLDWHMGTSVGALTFVAGQDGQLPDFYANASDDALFEVGQPTTELTEKEKVMSATPDSVRAFINAFDVPASPSFPTLADAAVTVRAGESADITLAGADPSGLTVSYVIDTPAQLGSAKATANGVQYTAAAGASGTESLTVRAVNGKLGSEPATLTVTVTGSPASPPEDPPASPPAPPAAQQPKAKFKLSGVRASVKGRTITVALRLSDRARVTVKAARRAGKRYRPAKNATRTLAAGKRSVKLRVARAGTYRLTLTARTQDGRTAKIVRTIRIKR